MPRKKSDSDTRIEENTNGRELTVTTNINCIEGNTVKFVSRWRLNDDTSTAVNIGIHLEIHDLQIPLRFVDTPTIHINKLRGLYPTIKDFTVHCKLYHLGHQSDCTPRDGTGLTLRGHRACQLTSYSHLSMGVYKDLHIHSKAHLRHVQFCPSSMQLLTTPASRTAEIDCSEGVFLANRDDEYEVFHDERAAVFWAGSASSVRKVSLDAARCALKTDKKSVIESARNATSRVFDELQFLNSLMKLGERVGQRLGKNPSYSDTTTDSQ